MAKLGVITDGISRDLAHALDVMDAFGLSYAELQFVGAGEVGITPGAGLGLVAQLVVGAGQQVPGPGQPGERLSSSAP